MRDVSGMSRVATVAQKLGLDDRAAVEILKRLGVADMRNYFCWIDEDTERLLVQHLAAHPEDFVARKERVKLGAVANPAILPTRSDK
jgi:hypothetical protein